MNAVTRIGNRNGWSVSAITDSLGSQIVMAKKGEENKLSKPFKDHEEAVMMAKRVLIEGEGITEWERPIQFVGDLLTKLYSRNARSFQTS